MVRNKHVKQRDQRSFVLTAVEVAAAAASSKDASGLGEGVTTSDYMLEVESRTITDEEGGGDEEGRGGAEVTETSPSKKKLSVKSLLGFKRKVKIRGADSAGGPKFTKQCWYICNQLGGGESGVLSTRPDVLHLRLVPWAGVAALISSSDDVLSAKTLTSSGGGGESTEVSFEGRGYCFLPLPVKTGLPLHVNGYFELSSNRRDIWHGNCFLTESILILIDLFVYAFV